MTISPGIRSAALSRPFYAIDGSAAPDVGSDGGVFAIDDAIPGDEPAAFSESGALASMDCLFGAALPAAVPRRVDDCLFLDKLDIRIQWMHGSGRWAVIRDIRAADTQGRPITLSVLEAEYGADDLPRLIINAGALLSRLQIINELDGMSAAEIAAGQHGQTAR